MFSCVVAMSIKLVLLALAVSLQCSLGFYLPGVAPHSFQAAEDVELKVNKLSSTKTSLPYEYYHLPFCKPETVRCWPAQHKHLRFAAGPLQTARGIAR